MQFYKKLREKWVKRKRNKFISWFTELPNEQKEDVFEKLEALDLKSLVKESPLVRFYEKSFEEDRKEILSALSEDSFMQELQEKKRQEEQIRKSKNSILPWLDPFLPEESILLKEDFLPSLMEKFFPNKNVDRIEPWLPDYTPDWMKNETSDRGRLS